MTKGRYAIVDPDDYEEINLYRWCIKFNGHNYYAERTQYNSGKRKKIFMHRQITAAPKGVIVDHININGLDNRKANLRFATATQNNWNSRRGCNKGTSKYKGVGWNKQRGKWRATLCNNSGKIHLGYFDNEKEAARTYDKAILEYRGEFAVLNNV